MGNLVFKSEQDEVNEPPCPRLTHNFLGLISLIPSFGTIGSSSERRGYTAKLEFEMARERKRKVTTKKP